MAVKNVAASVLARLLNQAKTEGMTYELCLQLFFQEEFLRRLSQSSYRKNMILKGGMFIYSLTEFDSRPTRDMDFMIRWISNDVQNFQDVVQQICEEKTENDYIRMETVGAKRITAEKKYPGVEVKIRGYIGNTMAQFSIDVGLDDVIVPEPTVRKIKTRLDGFVEPEILTYSVESTVAEKFDVILDRMEGTSRVKDFYDIYYLSTMFDFDGEVLSKALQSTTQHRNRRLGEDALSRLAKFPESDFFKQLWKNYQPAIDSGLDFSAVIKRILAFIGPVYSAILQGADYSGKWNCSNGRWENE